MEFTISLLGSSVGLFAAILLAIEFGRRLGIRRLVYEKNSFGRGTGAVEGSLFGLLGLLLAFTFTDAARKFEIRRELITQESNAIGTAFLRLDLLPAPKRDEIRKLFSQYVDARLQAYHGTRKVEDFRERLKFSTEIGTTIWRKAIECSGAENCPANLPMLLLPPLNEMLDISTTRSNILKNHPPDIIFFLLAALCILSGLTVGYGMAGNSSRQWLHIVILALTLSCTYFIIVDLEYPRFGLIRVDAADEPLEILRSAMP